jgi:hypothetical protein
MSTLLCTVHSCDLVSPHNQAFEVERAHATHEAAETQNSEKRSDRFLAMVSWDLNWGLSGPTACMESLHHLINARGVTQSALIVRGR